DIQKFSKFDRKHYFYPDLPKGYQISQYEQPLVLDGYVDFKAEGQDIRVSIVRVHLEEDAGKNTHPPGADYSLVDLNRAGTPLLEIVSYPDIHSPAQAKAYVRELYLLMKYTGVSDCDMYHGNLRFDINVSVSADPSKLGTRSEVKNLNSFRSVENAVAYEIKRQIELLEKGQLVEQETRGWDEAKQKTTAQRGKEEAHDYRYMPEPDIPPLELSDQYLADIKVKLPKMPNDIREELVKLSLDGQVIEDLLDRPTALDHTLDVQKAGQPDDARRAAFWFIHGEPAAPDDPDYVEPKVDTGNLIKLSQMVAGGRLSSTAARTVFDDMLKSGDDPDAIAKKLDLHQLGDEAEIEKIVTGVILQNPKVAADIRAGQEKAIGYLVGQVMTKTQGKANPAVAQRIIRKQLDLNDL
ncbi:hypothetical protein A3E49_00150, partial [Candidatus Saccharibacteria bacterium RIFCSPHIGHO2_12_FULL_49_19]